MYSAVAIANYFVARTAQDGVRDLSPAKLHDLVYLAHGWRLGIIGQSMIKTAVHAHRDGVFIPELREAGCWGTKRIESLVSVLRMDAARGMMIERSLELADNDPAGASLDWVWKTYGRLPPFEMSRLTREVGAPWDLIWNNEERTDDEPKLMPNGTIRLWFRELSAKRRQQEKGKMKLTSTQQFEASPNLEDTQQMLERPDPDRLRAL